MAAGTDPDSWLFARSRFVRPVRPAHRPGSDGMEPARLLPFRKLQHGSIAAREHATMKVQASAVHVELLCVGWVPSQLLLGLL